MLISHIFLLNKDISFDMRLTCWKMAIHVSETHLEGRVSLNFAVVISLNFLACSSGGLKINTTK